MSILNTYMQKEQQLKQLQEELDKLKNDDRLKTELDFKNHLEDLMSWCCLMTCWLWASGRAA